MASPGHLTSAHHSLQSSSISFSDSPSQGRPLRRWSTFGFATKNVDDSDQPGHEHTMKNRRRSFMDFLKPSKGEGQYNDLNSVNSHLGQSDGLSPHTSAEARTPTTPNTEQAPGHRRSLMFGSISSVGSAIRKSFSKITRRKDSAVSDNGSTPKNSIKREEVYRYTANLEPYAQAGVLRFRNMSVDNLLTSSAGPSTYYNNERYLYRECSVLRNSSYHRLGGESPDGIIDPSSPTPITKKEFSANPDRWPTLSEHTFEPASKRERTGLSRQLSACRLPGFLRSKQWNTRMKATATVKVTKPQNRGVSCAPSVASSTFSVSKPNIFRPVPNLELRVSNVLPTRDSTSINTEPDVPLAQYRPDSIDSSIAQPRHRTGIGLAAGSTASSRAPLCPVPAMYNSNSTPSSPDQSLLPHATPSHSCSLQDLSSSPSSTIAHYTYPPTSSRPLSTGESLCTCPHVSSNHSRGSMRTASDTVTSREGLGLRRMNSLEDMLEIYNVDGQRYFWFEVESDFAPCGVHCCGVMRGRRNRHE